MDDVHVFLEDNRYCKVPSQTPDPEEFPLYYKARKLEFVLNPGDRLFIPAGWFHFFCSETADEDLGVNLSVNFWYYSRNWNAENWHPMNDRDYEVDMIPKIEKHDIPTGAIFDILRNKKYLRCLRCKTLLFPPYQKRFQFPEGYMNWEYMSLEELLETKNPQYYMLQNETCTPELEKFNTFKYPTDIQTTAIWLNFGHKATSLMHYDNNDNWYCQMLGTRRVVLAHPSERDNLYPYNPLPLDTLRRLKSRDVRNDPVIARRSDSLSKELSDFLVESLGDEEQITIENEKLHELYEREYFMYMDHLRKLNSNDIPPPEKDAKFLIARITTRVGLSTHLPMYMLWTIGKGTVYIRGEPYNTGTGQITVCPNVFTYKVEIEGKGTILVIPTKEKSLE